MSYNTSHFTFSRDEYVALSNKLGNSASLKLLRDISIAQMQVIFAFLSYCRGVLHSMSSHDVDVLHWVLTTFLTVYGHCDRWQVVCVAMMHVA